MISNGALKQLGFSEEDYQLQDDSDGAGVYIKEWYSETAQPSDSDINTAHTTFQAAFDAKAYARSREAEYPTIQECVHAILDDDLTALQVLRQAVKDKYPK